MMPDRKRGLSSHSLKFNFPVFPARFENGQMIKAAIGVKCEHCGTEERMQINNKPAEDGWVTKSFQRKGWYVGRDRKHDLCPDCARKPVVLTTKPTTPEEPEPMKPVLAVVKEPTMAADPPREMGIEDRRIVFEKLNEVYLSKTEGYSNGWTDLRVAQDLGVPTSWVAKVREDFFGPVKTNAEAVALHTAIKDMQGTLADMDKSIANAEQLLKSIRERHDMQFQKMEQLTRLAKSIEKQF